jgi:hypothetical protein
MSASIFLEGGWWVLVGVGGEGRADVCGEGGGGREQGQGYLADLTWCIMATRHIWVFFNATHF